MKQYLEYVDANSSKFWQIEQNEEFLDITFGKIGTSGRSLRKEMKDPRDAVAAFKQEVFKKLKEGYTNPSVPILKPQPTSFCQNDPTFRHRKKVNAIHYYAPRKLLISCGQSDLYLWSKDGKLLDAFRFSDNKYFNGQVFIKEKAHTSQLLVSIHDFELDHIYLFDLKNDSFCLVKEKEIEVPFEGYYRDIDLDDEQIFLGVSNGLILLDYDLNTIQTLKSPQEDDNSNGVAVSAGSKLIAFVRWGGGSENKDAVLIVDTSGKVISKFEVKVHNQFGHAISFNKDGTVLYTGFSENYATTVNWWDPKSGKLLKEFVNYSSSGDILSFSVSEDEKWMAIRTAGVDIILWNLAEERVQWVKTSQELEAELCFTDDSLIYQSAGNGIVQITVDNKENQDVKGLSSSCENIFFDDKRQHLWLAGGSKVFRLNSAGAIDYWTGAESFTRDRSGSKLLLSRGMASNAWGHDYFWLDLDNLRETPFMSGVFRGLDFDDEILISTESGFSQNEPATKVWNHNGRLLREIKPKVSENIYLLDKEHFLITKEKKMELWGIEENQSIITLKSFAAKVKIHARLDYFLTTDQNQVKLWDGKSEEPLSLELLPTEVQDIISEEFLEEFVIIDSVGGIYTLNPVSMEFKQIAGSSSKISKAALSVDGKLYVVTEELEILILEFGEFLNLKQADTEKVATGTSAFTISEKDLEGKNILHLLQNINWQGLSEENFLQLRSGLFRLEQQHGLGEGHRYFTERMFEQGAKLRHTFAHEEEWSSFAMSSDGKYLAVGTWVGENYQEDGTIQIWEVTTGRCVNLLQNNYGGIGWPDYPFNLQWSPDNQLIGAALNTNSVASINPFATSAIPFATATVTDGWDRPPAWCWLGDSSAFVVSCWHDSEIPACICKTDQFTIYEDDARWFAKTITPSLSKELEGIELQPYDVCQASKDGKLIYGYNRHDQIYGIDVDSGQLAWLIQADSPVEFSPAGDFGVYGQNGQIQIVELKTGKVREVILESEAVAGFEFAPQSQRYAAYKDNRITVFDYNQKIVAFELKSALLPQNYLESELRSVRFNRTGDQIACLLTGGVIEVWSLAEAEPTQVMSYQSKASGIYWGEAIVAVSDNYLEFVNENGKRINYCNKEAQVEAYHDLYPDVASPLQISNNNMAERFDIRPLYPLKHQGRAEWMVAVETGVIVSACKDIEELDHHLSYTWDNKYAWPLTWGKSTIYAKMEQARNDPKLPFSEKERALFKTTPKKVQKELELVKSGSLMDVINLYQAAVEELDPGWDYHISRQFGIITPKLVALGKYQEAYQLIENTPEWYLCVANFGFLAIDLARNDQMNLARESFTKGVAELNNGKERYLKGWAVTFVYAPLAAAAKLVGETETANEYFHNAELELAHESNPFEKYSQLGICYLLCGEIDRAMEVMKSGPWGSYFTSHQLDFVKQLLNVGQLDLAISYAKLGFEKCSDMKNWDLCSIVLESLLAQRRFDEAVLWIDNFQGMATDDYEERLLAESVKAGRREWATVYLLNKLKDNTWPNSFLRYLRILSDIDPARSQQMMAKLPDVRDAYYKDRYYADLAQAKLQIGILNDAFNTLDLIQNDQYQLVYLTNLLTRPVENRELQIAILQKALAILESSSIEAKDRIPLLIKLHHAAQQIDQSETAELIIGKIEDLAGSCTPKDDRDTFYDIQKFYTRLERWDDAYRMLKKQMSRERIHVIGDLLLELSKKGYWKTAVTLLMTLPAKDLNDRPKAALSIIENVNGEE